MKKFIYTLAAIAALAGAFASCTQQLVPQALNGPAEALSLKPVAGSSLTKAAPIDGTAFPAVYDMIVSAYYNAAEGSSANYFSGIRFQKVGDTWSEAKYWPLSGTLDIFAYTANDGTSNVVTAAPVYGAKVSDGATLTVSNNATAQVDIMHAYAAAQEYSASGTPMEFKHAQASIAFTAESNVAYNAGTNAGITITGITLNGAKYSGTLAISKDSDPTDGYCVWSSLGSQADKALSMSAYNVPDHAHAIDITSAGNHFGIGNTGILVPEQDQTSFTIFYTMHNGKKADGSTNDDVANLQYTYNCSGSWEEGKKYVYNIVFTLNKIEIVPSVLDWVLESEDVDVPEAPAAAATFAGLQIAAGPLYFDGTDFAMYDDWNHSSYDSVYDKNANSTYFNFIEMGKLFEKADFSGSDGDIDNLLDPLDGWRLPTQAEWASIIGTTREGSTVNGTAGAHWAFIQLTGVTHAGFSTPYGLLIFPDGKTITGKALDEVDKAYEYDDVNDEDVYYCTTGVTSAELTAYLAQGCAFLPASGYYIDGDWLYGGSVGYYWSSTESNVGDGYYLYFYDDGVYAGNSDNKSDNYGSVRLVKDAS